MLDDTDPRPYRREDDPPTPGPQLTDAERSLLRRESWAPEEKADALVHAAFDVAAELYDIGPIEGYAMNALLFVFIQRALQFGRNPGNEMRWCLGQMGLSADAITALFKGVMDPDEVPWTAEDDALVAPWRRERETHVGITWAQIKERALRALVPVAVGTASEERNYMRELLGEEWCCGCPVRPETQKPS